MDWFTRARYAAWAGDIEYCRELLKFVTNNFEDATPLRSDTSGLILQAALELSEHLHSERHLPFEGGNLHSDITETPNIGLITTEHLRGVIHQISDYDFELRAYLNDLSWEKELYERASIVASIHRRPEIEESEHRLPDNNLLSDEMSLGKNRRPRRRTASWRIVGKDFNQIVSVGPFCLIKVKGSWTADEAPRNTQIRHHFEDTLDEIESRRIKAEKPIGKRGLIP